MDVAASLQRHRSGKGPPPRHVWQPRRAESTVHLEPPTDTTAISTPASLPPSHVAPLHLDPALIVASDHGSQTASFESASRRRPRRPSGRAIWQRRSAECAEEVTPPEAVFEHFDSHEIASAASSAKRDAFETVSSEAGSQHSEPKVASSSLPVYNVDGREESTTEDASEASSKQHSPETVLELLTSLKRRSMDGELPGTTPQYLASGEISVSTDFSEEVTKEATTLSVISHLEPLKAEAVVDSTEKNVDLKLQKDALSVYCCENDVDRFQLHFEEYPAVSTLHSGCLGNAVSEAVTSEVISQCLKTQDVIGSSIDLLKLQDSTVSVDSDEGAKEAAFEQNFCNIQSCLGRSNEDASEPSVVKVTEHVPSNHHLESNVDSSEENGKESAAPQLPKSGEFTAFVKVDAPFLKFVTGKRGETKHRIENETATEIHVPCLHEVKRGASIVIKGQSQEKVDEAVSKLQAVFHEAEESSSLEYSHFISLPLALHPTLKERIIRFHESVFSLVAEKKMQPSEPHGSLDDTSTEMEGTVSVSGADQVVDASEEADPTEMICVDDLEPKTEEEIIVLNKDEKEEDSVIDLKIPSSDAIGTNKLPANCTGSTVEVRDDENVPPKAKRDFGIEASIFIKPTRLHLTVLMLKLWNKERVDTAAKVLQSVQPKLLDALDHHPISVRLKGLECMKGSPKKAHVLYAHVEETDETKRLTQACNIIRDVFVEAGLVSQKEQSHELKLHATLMNTMHRTRRKGKRHSKRIPFDAREILLKHGSEDWGEYEIVEVHLSERFAYGEDDYYHCCGCIRFPLTPTSA